MSYDVIGDLHGHALALESLLERMGYAESGGTFSHPERTAVFVGDFVDRGPRIRETVGIVRRMIESGAALAVMGNHEYNSICFNRQRSEESHRWLRARTDKHLYQHIETLYQFRNHREEWRSHLEWFYLLPLYLDLKAIRIVHAAWDPPSLDVLSSYSSSGNSLTEELLDVATRRGSRAFCAIQNVLKGVEVELPQSHMFIDKDGNERKDMRVRWWIDAARRTYRELAIPSRPEVNAASVSEADAARIPGYRDRVPVFIGHYWLDDSTPAILSSYVACLDYSVARGGYLAAYRWQGERELRNEHFVVQE